MGPSVENSHKRAENGTKEKDNNKASNLTQGIEALLFRKETVHR